MNNTLVAMVIGTIAINVGYNCYTRRIDRDVIRADPNKATPARMYMDGVDFVPTNRNVLYRYHLNSIAAPGQSSAPSPLVRCGAGYRASSGSPWPLCSWAGPALQRHRGFGQKRR